MDPVDVLSLMRRVADSPNEPSQHVSPFPHSSSQRATVEEQVYPEQNDALLKVKRDLKAVVLELEKEMAQRFQIEAALQREREMLFPSKHAKVMQLRDTEISELENQRDTMSAWLKRGVREAERAAKELSVMKGTLAEAQRQEEDAKIMISDITAAQHFKEDELKEISAKVTALSEAKMEMLKSLENQDNLMETTEQSIEKSSRNASTYSADRISLKTHARRLELIEAAVSCIAASVRRAHHSLRKVKFAIDSGDADLIDPLEDDGFDSEEDAGSSVFPPKVALHVRPLIQEVSELSDEVSRQIQSFTADQSKREAERMNEHVRRLASERANNAKAREECERTLSENLQVIMNMERERAALLEFLQSQQSATVQALQSLGRNPQRRRPTVSPQNNSFAAAEIDVVFDDSDNESNYSSRRTTKSVLPGPPSNLFVMPKKLTALEQIFEIVQSMKADVQALERSNTKWTDKVGSQEDDYATVKSLRNSYRDLESTKTMLSIEIRESEEKNKELKLLILDYSDMHNMYTIPT